MSDLGQTARPAAYFCAMQHSRLTRLVLQHLHPGSNPDQCLDSGLVRQAGVPQADTVAIAATVAPMFLLFNAATQMRPESTP